LLHQGRLGHSHASLGAQLAKIGAHEPGEASVLREQFVCQSEGIIALASGAQDDGQ
jgi:hypothetical protein